MSRQWTSRQSYRRAGYSALCALIIAIAACALDVRSPERAIAKMTRAYGGPDKIARLQSYVGKGFIKDLSQEIAASNAFDVCVKAPRYKHKIYQAPQGTLVDIVILTYDGTETREWTRERGLRSVPPMDLMYLKYRFPAVLEWVNGAKLAGELLPAEASDSEVGVRYRDGDVIVTLRIDRKSGLLSGIELGGAIDTSFSYIERYEHYHDVDGIPFPGTFTASYKGSPYFDYVLPAVVIGAELPDSMFAVTAADTAALAGAPKIDQPAPQK